MTLPEAIPRVALRRLFRRFERIETDISDFERGAWRSAAGAPDLEPVSEAESGPLRHLLPDAEATYRRTGQHLSQLGRPTRGAP